MRKAQELTCPESQQSKVLERPCALTSNCSPVLPTASCPATSLPCPLRAASPSQSLIPASTSCCPGPSAAASRLGAPTASACNRLVHSSGDRVRLGEKLPSLCPAPLSHPSPTPGSPGWCHLALGCPLSRPQDLRDTGPSSACREPAQVPSAETAQRMLPAGRNGGPHPPPDPAPRACSRPPSSLSQLVAQQPGGWGRVAGVPGGRGHSQASPPGS